MSACVLSIWRFFCVLDKRALKPKPEMPEYRVPFVAFVGAYSLWKPASSLKGGLPAPTPVEPRVKANRTSSLVGDYLPQPFSCSRVLAITSSVRIHSNHLVGVQIRTKRPATKIRAPQ